MGRNLPLPYGLLLGSVAYHLSGDPYLSAAMAVASFAGTYTSVRFLGPDVDLPGRTFNERGRIGAIIAAITHPLTKFTHHRGITHVPFAGTFIIYAPILLALAALVYYQYIPVYIFGAYYFGALMGDFWHIAADHDPGLKEILDNRSRWDYTHEH